jgi:hypothetical protein
MSGDTLPTWEELLRGVGRGAGPDLPARSASRFGTAPRHVRSFPGDKALDALIAPLDGVRDWAGEWNRIVRGLRAGDGLTWREAWAWTLLATACAALATRGAALLP